MLRRIREDLWETQGESPFAGLTTHAYLWTAGSGRNVLFYSTVTDADFDEIERLGGVAHMYLSHHDEAGPMVREVAKRFGAQVHAGRGDAQKISSVADDAVWLDSRTTDGNGVESIPTPGHTPGSFCYVVKGSAGDTYLFTGDTLYTERDGSWAAGNLAFSNPVTLGSSLDLLATLRPNVVASSAAPAGVGVHDVDEAAWGEIVAQIRSELPT